MAIFEMAQNGTFAFSPRRLASTGRGSATDGAGAPCASLTGAARGDAHDVEIAVTERDHGARIAAEVDRSRVVLVNGGRHTCMTARPDPHRQDPTAKMPIPDSDSDFR